MRPVPPSASPCWCPSPPAGSQAPRTSSLVSRSQSRQLLPEHLPRLLRTQARPPDRQCTAAPAPAADSSSASLPFQFCWCQRPPRPLSDSRILGDIEVTVKANLRL